MRSEVSSGTVAFLSLFVVCSMVAGATGIAMATTAADGSLEEASGIDTSPSDIESSFDSTDSIDDTADSLEEELNETSETVDGSTDEPTDDEDETATKTSDAIDETSTDAAGAVHDTSDGTNDTADSVGDPIDSVNETTEAVQNTTNETTGELDERVDETSEPLEDTVDETTDGVDDVTNGTADEADSFLEDPVDSTADALEPAAGAAEDTISSPISTIASVQIPGTDGSLSSVVDGESALEAVAGGAPTDPGTGQIAADTVLVGLMGAMTASAGAAGGIGGAGGAVAGAGAAGGASAVGGAGVGTASGAGGVGAGATAGSGVAGGASGAGAAGGAGGASGGGLASGASSAVANWSASGRRSLRRALAAIPWELIPILKYSRYDDSDPLENETRNAIYETLEADPGRYLSQISDEIDVPLSTVRHHVRILEEEDLLTTAKINGKRRYYLEEIDSKLQAALEEPAKRDVLEALGTLERANNSELAAELDRDPSTVTHHLSTLEDDGLVVRERDGRSIVSELTPETSAALFEDENTTLDDPSPQAPAD